MLSLLKLISHPNSRRYCPDCNVLMASYQCEEAIVERCNSCNGVWFDEREIAQFRSGLEKLDLEDLKPELLKNSESTQLTVSTCPVCKAPLIDGRYTYNSKVSVKRCQQCEGIWLSGGQILRFVDFVRISQLIAPHIKAIAEENKKTFQSQQNLKNIVDSLTIRLTPDRRTTIYHNARIGNSLILPLYTDSPIESFPWMTLGLILVHSCIFFFIGYDFVAWQEFGLIPAHMWNSWGWITLFTGQYLHSGAIHLVCNCLFLWLFGSRVEGRLRTLKFFILYNVTGVAAGMIYVLLNPTSTLPAIGSSGAVSGVLGAYFVLFPRAMISTFISGQIFRIHIAVYLIFWIGLNFVVGWQEYTLGSSGIAWTAHLAGFLSGIVFMHLFRRKVAF